VKSGLIIRHVPHEGIAGFREPIDAAGYVLDRIDVADPRFPTLDLREPDLVIMMGGPMSVYEHATYPWIACQQHRLAQRLELDRPTLGVCLGAQLMAAALGAEVHRGPVKEVGFHPLEVRNGDKALCILTDRRKPVMLRATAGTRILLSLADPRPLREALEESLRP
jgi:GMP synthase (glutamine-hydrolysing)